ncbi:MAG: metallophosphoesterase [Cyclobacteriaceae bacterium]
MPSTTLQNSILVFVLVLLLGLSACQQEKPEAPAPQVFVNDVTSGPTPWSSDDFNDAEDKFTFAIISDLYGGERAGVFEVAVEQLNLLQPEFILSVGDLIDGGTEDREQLIKEWEHFDQRVNKAEAPFFHLGGNHDLTNVVMREVWQERYGPRYYHFAYKDVLFLMMDSEDYDEDRMHQIYLARARAIELLDGPTPELADTSLYYRMEERRTGEINNAQIDYFKQVLEQYKDVRWTFLLMHKPVWMREDTHGLQQIESAMADRDYTVINGHFHSFSHRTLNDRDYMILGTTSGSQNPKDETSFDHVTLVTMKEEPKIAHLRLDGILDKTGEIPLNGDTLCFQASLCQ